MHHNSSVKQLQFPRYKEAVLTYITRFSRGAPQHLSISSNLFHFKRIIRQNRLCGENYSQGTKRHPPLGQVSEIRNSLRRKQKDDF